MEFSSRREVSIGFVFPSMELTSMLSSKLLFVIAWDITDGYSQP